MFGRLRRFVFITFPTFKIKTFNANYAENHMGANAVKRLN